MRVIITGRANVGKSTLFNKIVEKKQALVSDISGTTRDTNISDTEWTGYEFKLYDTAGLGMKPKDIIEEKFTEQGERNIGRADLVLFVIDGQQEILPQDKKMANILRKAKKNVILVINKIDSQKLRKNLDLFELGKLGFKNMQIISGSSGAGVGDLLDKVVEELKKKNPNPLPLKEKSDLEEINVCLLGKPNAGKSSIMNALIKRKVHIKEQEEVIVTNIAHTTREPQERKIVTDKHIINFVDTAGIRKQSNIDKGGLEILSVRKSIGSLKESDIVLFILDLSEQVTAQSKKITSFIEDNNNGFIIVGNKWDLVENKTTESDREVQDYIRDQFAHLKWAPIIFTSAIEGKNVVKIIDLIENIYEERKKKIGDKELEIFIGEMIKRKRPIRAKGDRNPKIRSFEQIRTSPPVFRVTIGPKETIHFSYLRYLENRLRERYGFFGTPIKISVKTIK